MRITELYIKNFGKFTDTQFSLSEKIHVFYGENEYGKSTIYAFIKAMLFGMERGRGRAAGKDDFSRYEPWENPNYYAGMMRFTCGGRNFRLERQFDRYAKQAILICEDDGEELSVEAGDLEMLLGGMNRVSFENTAAIGRLTAKPGQELADELKNYAANYCETGGGEIDLQGAMETLKARKKAVEQKQREYQNVRKQKLDKFRIQSDYLQHDAKKLEAELQEKKEELNLYQKQQKNTEKNIFLIVGCVLAAVGAAGLLWSFFTKAVSVSAMGHFFILFLFSLVVGLVLAGIAFVRELGVTGMTSHRKKQKEESLHEEGLSADVLWQEQRQKKVGYRREQLKDTIQELCWECQRIQEEWKEKQIQLHNLQEQIEEAELQDSAVRQLEMEKQAIDLAAQRLKNTAEAMTKDFGTRLNREASTILSEITDGKYSRLLIDESFELSVYNEGRKIPVERLSRGTIEQIYFSLRMASLDILYEEEIPVILDDAFVFYDEKRLKSVLKWLSEQPRQVIIFSCQRREEEILKIF